MLFDVDQVKRENITRSPIFAERDIGSNKVEVTSAYLKSCGITDIADVPLALHESRHWQDRSAGTPDLVVSAANEHNVRHLIESLFPPVQIYGTTGKNWQAAVVRHAPMIDPCSCCLFPEATHTPTMCATDQAVADQSDDRVDASLPFLSFAAGLMAAAEILKLQIPGYSMHPNRAFLATRPDVRFSRSGMTHRPGCPCATRSKTAHLEMIKDSLYASLPTDRIRQSA